jgi:hypothetical protein
MPSAPDPECRARGQAAVEYVAWVALVAALCAALGAAAVAAGIPRAVADTIGRALGHDASDASQAAPIDRTTAAIAIAAVYGSPDGGAATVADAEALLAATIGPDAARAEMTRLALAHFESRHRDRVGGVKEVVAYGAEGRLRDAVAGVGPPSAPQWHGEEVRRLTEPATAHVVTEADARRLRDALQRQATRDLRRDQLYMLAVEAGLTYLVGWLRAPLIAVQFVQAVTAKERRSAFPPGMRADDVVLCFPVRRRNVFSSVQHRRGWGTPPDGLDIGRWHDMTHLVTLRSGTVVAETMSDATSCA